MSEKPAEASLKVLVVDDEVDLAAELVALLGDYGVLARATRGFTEATIALSEERFDAVVSDYKMPGKSGLELLRAVRSGSNPSLPFFDHWVSRQRAESFRQQLGAVIIEKPYVVADLITRLAKLK